MSVRGSGRAKQKRQPDAPKCQKGGGGGGGGGWGGGVGGGFVGWFGVGFVGFGPKESQKFSRWPRSSGGEKRGSQMGTQPGRCPDSYPMLSEKHASSSHRTENSPVHASKERITDPPSIPESGKEVTKKGRHPHIAERKDRVVPQEERVCA